MFFWGRRFPPKKRTKTSLIVVKLNSFVHFLEEIDNPKNHFEINWPLETGRIFLFVLGRMEDSTISLWDLRTFSFLRKKSNAQKFLILFQEKGPFLNANQISKPSFHTTITFWDFLTFRERTINIVACLTRTHNLEWRIINFIDIYWRR